MRAHDPALRCVDVAVEGGVRGGDRNQGQRERGSGEGYGAVLCGASEDATMPRRREGATCVLSVGGRVRAIVTRTVASTSQA